MPLGSKVWVEGYGEAIAGDTGGAIKGNRIDVLVGSDGSANSWGRKSVKVKVIEYICINIKGGCLKVCKQPPFMDY
ncbi:hypothetical protein TuanDB_42290 [Bacillus anthracis]|uniref:3D domain-containing protein n=1 Tax=Bacillus anthracis TaxID=1392 RepID=A0A640LSJ4_BACAN|nr:hypothetical protein TuanDB_42290 [Bacillus anthracis]